MRLRFLRTVSHIWLVSEMLEMTDKMTVRVAPDVRRALETWAEINLSTMTAELNRSVRLRAAQDRRAERKAEAPVD